MRKINSFADTAASGRILLDLGDGTQLDSHDLTPMRGPLPLPGANYTVGAGGRAELTRFGSLVLLDLYAVTPVDVSAYLAVIPTGYRPAGSVILGSNGLYASGGRILIYTSGAMQQLNTTVGGAMYGHASWRTTDPLPAS